MKLAYIVTLFLAAVQCQDFLKIPLVRHKSALEILLKQKTHPKHLRKIFGQSKEKLGPKPLTNDTVTLYKFALSQFYGEVLIGRPGQKFNMLLDTRFDYTWVTSVLCSPFAFPACAFKNRYDSAKSESYVQVGTNFTLKFPEGRLSGVLSKDKFHVGHINILNQTFAEIEQMTLLRMIYNKYDGVIGLGFSTNPNDSNLPFIQNLFKQPGYRIKPVFSIYINRDKNTAKGGSIFLGGSDPSHYRGSFTNLAVTNVSRWEFQMDKIIINRTSSHSNKLAEACASGCKAFFVTSEFAIYGPYRDIKNINRLISANYVPYLDRYEISCTSIQTLPHMVFLLGGHNFTLYGKDYIQEVSYGPVQMCLSAFTELRDLPKDEEIWGLGIPFLGRYYVMFNILTKTIGIANMSDPY